MVLDGHNQAIYSISFSPNGYQIATGAGDCTVRIWDMRSLKSLYNIPAHLSNVSDLKFFHADDQFFKPPASEMEMDQPELESDPRYTTEEWNYRSGLFFASSGYDGLVKIWSADDWQLLRTLTTDAGKVMTVDISSSGRMIASGTYNRNFQLFSPEE
jgi:U4/U6 small nuclear ribonucleoprotein PRP4